MTIDNELIDNLPKDYKKPEDIIGENGLLKQLTKQLLERAMAAELTEHVGYEKHDTAGHKSGNSRNGKSAKTLKGSFGTMPIEIPRDRNGTFAPQIIEKHQTRFTGFDQNIISLYARGLSTREIQQHLEEIYHVEVSPALISSVTDEVIDEVKTWQNRQLDAVYPIMYLDAIRFKVRDGGHVRNKAIYLAIAITVTGMKEVLGLWIAVKRLHPVGGPLRHAAHIEEEYPEYVFCRQPLPSSHRGGKFAASWKSDGFRLFAADIAVRESPSKPYGPDLSMYFINPRRPSVAANF